MGSALLPLARCFLFRLAFGIGVGVGIGGVLPFAPPPPPLVRHSLAHNDEANQVLIRQLVVHPHQHFLDCISAPLRAISPQFSPYSVEDLRSVATSRSTHPCIQALVPSL
ncbi:hypothetical protein MKEN_01117400 [Mycena kentingensis (nom. inval.)]|nr:hypothetical protein MKEN_01117400 [Mycena kentingensis (nom. inval.)]